jgi:hypothetical protein
VDGRGVPDLSGRELFFRETFHCADARDRGSGDIEPPHVRQRVHSASCQSESSGFFFTALLPRFINPRQPGGAAGGDTGITSLVLEFFILLAYGILAGTASEIARQPRFATITNRIAGVLLAGAGAGLAVLDR